MKPEISLALCLAMVAATTGIANATIRIGQTSSTLVRIRISRDDSPLAPVSNEHETSILEGFNFLAVPSSSPVSGSSSSSGAMSQRLPCPEVQLGANSNLDLSVEVDGQDCSGYHGSAPAHSVPSICPQVNLKAVSSCEVYVAAKQRRPSAIKSNFDCPGIDIRQSSGVHITIRLSKSRQYGPFAGINLKQRSGVTINTVVNLGDCPVPSISMNQVSGTIIRIHDES